MARALIPAEDILTRALELLDTHGPDALNVRSLSSDLRISPNTLYNQVGTQEQLTRALVARHFTQLNIDFTEFPTWEETAAQWCVNLHAALMAHPHLTNLMTIDDRAIVTNYVHALLDAIKRGGIPSELATDCCRSLTNLTINQSIVQARAMTEPRRSSESAEETQRIEDTFPRLVNWVIKAVADEAASIADSV